MTNLTMLDAAYLPANHSSLEVDVWGVYIGGAATHIWPDTDIKKVSHYPKLPIYVLRPGRTGTFCGLECIMALYKLGIPRGTAIALDVEPIKGQPFDLEEVKQAVIEFFNVLKFFGYIVWKYGSTSYLFELINCDGSWVATDSHVREFYSHPGVVATQYEFGTDNDRTDTSIIHRFAVHHRLSESWGING